MMAGVAVLMMMWLTVFVDETMSLDNTNVMTEMLQQRLASADYNSRIRPGADGDAVIVYINIEVQDISSISEVNMEYSMSLFLTQIWTDNRLAFPEFSRNLTLNYNLLSQIWAPDLFVRNLKSGLFQNITVPNLLLSLSPDGTMFFSQRLTLTLVCGMQLERYPMDNQTCTIEFGSYGYTVVDIIFLWRLDAPAVVMDYNISLPEYNIDNISSLVCVHSGIGQKPCIRASFHLSRRIRAYVLSTYLPQLLVVVVSWVSLWMDPCSAPARTSLGITTVLAMITTQGYGQNGMPSGSITKAIDVWMLTCLVFVFAAFVEFSIVNTLVRRQKALKALKAKSCPSGDGTSLATQSDTDESKRVNRVKSYFNHFREAPAEAIEKTCRVMFPLTFLIFNVVYWPYYTFSMTPAPN